MGFYILKNDSKYFANLETIEQDSTVQKILQLKHIRFNSHTNIKEEDLIKEIPKLDFLSTRNKLPRHIFKAAGILSRGLIIDEDLYSSLNHLKWADHIATPTKILYRKKFVCNYIYIYFIENCIKFSDWQTTKFYDENKYSFQVSNKEELIKSKESHNTIYIEECNLLPTFPQYDVFGLFLVESEVYYSEKFKQALENQKIPEIEFVGSEKVKYAVEH